MANLPDDWETITLRQDNIILHRAKWWQFWVPHYKPISLEFSVRVKGVAELHGLQIETTEGLET